MHEYPVLIATEFEDPTADLVIGELNKRKVPILRFDPGTDFPANAVLAASTNSGGWDGRLTVGGRSADLSQVRALYHRRPSSYLLRDDGQVARFVMQENRRGLGGVLGALPNCLYLSHPQAIARAEYKPAQLATANRVGFRVPATLITNDPAEAVAFSTTQPTVYKPLHAGSYEVDGEPAGIWASPVDPEEITESVKECAHLFQAQVSKTSDVRVVVVGSRFFCARITAPPGVVDWRSQYRNLSYEKVPCPVEIQQAILRFLSEFGLRFGAFDFSVTADEAWWFLECNPNGQWAWLEEAAQLPIAMAIAELLENGLTK
ncbi:ATP-grasp ribosomal peptide maturase [Streptomyces sp. NPDC005963]|uniref:ATP-grasp ribosomal peptide maturase n=1 Tax=Streptomyces sp. NPDC005963 TaxID=3156721 RepID=UPI0034071A7A